MNKEELEELHALLNMDAEDTSSKKSKKGLDIMGLVKTLWSKRKYFYISVPITLVVAVLLSLCIPPYYVVEVKLAPELSGSSSAGLGGLLKSLGSGRMPSNGGDADAILPNLYPDLMNSQTFLVSLFNIPVVSKDGEINTTYYDYLRKYQKSPWWTELIGMALSAIISDDDEVTNSNVPSKARSKSQSHEFNPSALTKRQMRVVKAISKNVVCDVDKKTFVISIAVKDQDPLICATVADSTCKRLQEFITEYRTKKARVEYEHMVEQYKTARQEYEEAKERVSAYNDANWDLVEEDFVVEKMALQNEMQLRFSALSAINTQLLAARSKLDEARPVFTVLDGATVPLKPIGPKKKKIVVELLFLVCAVQSMWLLRHNLLNNKEEE